MVGTKLGAPEVSVPILIGSTPCYRFERPPTTEPKEWWHKMVVQRKNVFFSNNYGKHSFAATETRVNFRKYSDTYS